MRRFLVVLSLVVSVVASSAVARADDEACKQVVAVAQDVALNALRTGHITLAEYTRAANEIVERGGTCSNEHTRAQFEDLMSVLRDFVE